MSRLKPIAYWTWTVQYRTAWVVEGSFGPSLARTVMQDIQQVAVYQRRLLFLMAALCVFSLFITFPGARFQQGTSILILVVAVLLSATSVILVLRIVRAMGGSLVAQSVVAVLMFVPWVSVIALLVVNHKATKMLRSRGLRVGLMGVSKQELEKFEVSSGDFHPSSK